MTDHQASKYDRAYVKNEGLRYPSIDKLLVHIDSKYQLAYAAALRAKLIKERDDLSIKAHCVKPVGMALEEIEAGKVVIEFEK